MPHVSDVARVPPKWLLAALLFFPMRQLLMALRYSIELRVEKYRLSLNIYANTMCTGVECNTIQISKDHDFVWSMLFSSVLFFAGFSCAVTFKTSQNGISNIAGRVELVRSYPNEIPLWLLCFGIQILTWLLRGVRKDSYCTSTVWALPMSPMYCLRPYPASTTPAANSVLQNNHLL